MPPAQIRNTDMWDISQSGLLARLGIPQGQWISVIENNNMRSAYMWLVHANALKGCPKVLAIHKILQLPTMLPSFDQTQPEQYPIETVWAHAAKHIIDNCKHFPVFRGQAYTRERVTVARMVICKFAKDYNRKSTSRTMTITTTRTAKIESVEELPIGAKRYPENFQYKGSFRSDPNADFETNRRNRYSAIDAVFRELMRRNIASGVAIPHIPFSSIELELSTGYSYSASQPLPEPCAIQGEVPSFNDQLGRSVDPKQFYKLMEGTWLDLQSRLEYYLNDARFSPDNYLEVCHIYGWNPRRPQVKGFVSNCVLKPHQVMGIHFLLTMESSEMKRAIIADFCAADKATTILGYLVMSHAKYCREATPTTRSSPSLLVVPPSAIKKWLDKAQEVLAHDSSLSVTVYVQEDGLITDFIEPQDFTHGGIFDPTKVETDGIVIFTSYDLVGGHGSSDLGSNDSGGERSINKASEPHILRGLIKRIICDEGYRNSGTLRVPKATLLTALKGKMRVAITSPQVLNNASDGVKILQFLEGDDDMMSIGQTWEDMNVRQKCTSAAFKRYILPLMTFTSKSKPINTRERDLQIAMNRFKEVVQNFLLRRKSHSQIIEAAGVHEAWEFNLSGFVGYGLPEPRIYNVPVAFTDVDMLKSEKFRAKAYAQLHKGPPRWGGLRGSPTYRELQLTATCAMLRFNLQHHPYEKREIAKRSTPRKTPKTSSKRSYTQMLDEENEVSRQQIPQGADVNSSSHSHQALQAPSSTRSGAEQLSSSTMNRFMDTKKVDFLGWRAAMKSPMQEFISCINPPNTPLPTTLADAAAFYHQEHPKLLALDMIIKHHILDKGKHRDKIILGVEHLAVSMLLETYLLGLGLNIKVLHTKQNETVAEKLEIQSSFNQDDDIDILIIPTDFGEDMDLHHRCHVMVLYERLPNGYLEDQFVARLTRSGQVFNPIVYRLITLGTFDQTIDIRNHIRWQPEVFEQDPAGITMDCWAWTNGIPSYNCNEAQWTEALGYLSKGKEDVAHDQSDMVAGDIQRLEI